MQFALHASHAALPVLTSNFLPTVALPVLDKNVTIMQPFQSAKCITLSQTYLYTRGTQVVHIAQCAKMCAAQPARVQMMQWHGPACS
jgi:hypothetical protein